MRLRFKYPEILQIAEFDSCACGFGYRNSAFSNADFAGIVAAPVDFVAGIVDSGFLVLNRIDVVVWGPRGLQPHPETADTARATAYFGERARQFYSNGRTCIEFAKPVF